MSIRAVLVVALLLAAPTLALAPTASACGAASPLKAGIPCGRIYPIILIKIPDQQSRYDIVQGQDLVFNAELTYKFSIAENGYTAATDPIRINFEFPRLPDWASLVVAPDSLDIPVNNPTYLQPDAADPSNPQAEYSYTAPIEIRARLNGEQPVLRDGYEFAKLLVFAKSTESGLYQSGYGIKEIRVTPDRYVFESDIAGEKDVFTATPLDKALVTGGSQTIAGTTITFTPPAEVAWWQPAAYTVKVDPAPTGRMVVAITGEDGGLVALHGPVSAVTGSATFNATLAHPGAHVASVTLLPDAGTRTPALSFTIPFTAGDIAAEGFAYPKSYLQLSTEIIPPPVGNTDDASVQFARDIPFFAFDTAQSTVVTVTLLTPGGAIDRGTASLQFAVIDSEGKQLQVNTVDPSNPSRGIRIGSLPGDGWYAVRITGLGVPTFSSYLARVEAVYNVAPELRNPADGVVDITGGQVSLGGQNLTLPTDGMAVWTPQEFTPTLEGKTNAATSLTIRDRDGRIAYASGLRPGEPMAWTPSAPGTYQAVVYLEPTRGAAFSPMQRVFTFLVGEGASFSATKFQAADTLPVARSTQATFLGAFQLPLPLDGSASTSQVTAGPGVTATAVVLDKNGDLVKEAPFDGTDTWQSDLTPADAPYSVLVYGSGPLGGSFAFDVTRDFQEAVVLTDPDANPQVPANPARIPGIALGFALAVIGTVAVAVAFMRKR